MKKHFITGVIILLPLAVTIVLVIFVINFLTQPFVGVFERILETYPWYLKFQGIIRFFIQILLVALLFFFTVLLGLLARIVVFKSFLSLYDYVLHRIPVIKTIYKAAQQLIRTILGTNSRSFKQVVMVPFPTEKSYCIGLISGEAPSVCQSTLAIPLLTVFVPTTPNPTSGFLMMYPEDQVIYVDMKVEDAFKYIISCGVITSEEPITNPSLDE